MHQKGVSARQPCYNLMLSHQTSMCLPCHCSPHMAYASTMGISSFAAIDTGVHSSVHGNCSHDSFQDVPHPHFPEASEAKTISGNCDSGLEHIIAWWFQDGKNTIHQAKSLLASSDGCNQWCNLFACVDSVISRRKEIRPTHTTLHAC